MNSLTTIAASGMRSRMETLDLLANNLANASTAGYKADQEAYSLYFGDSAREGYEEGRPDAPEMPVVQNTWTDLSQGTLLPTGNPTDLALATKGFFAVQGSNGPIYTRNGHLKVAQNGQLQTQEGYSVLDTNGKAITLDRMAGFEVSPGGELRQAGAPVATILVVSFDPAAQKERMGGGYYRFAADWKPTAVAAPDLQQGKVEASNSSPSNTAVKLVTVMRSFEMLQKAITLSSEMDRRVVEDVAKVNS